MSRILTHPDIAEALVRGRRGIPDAELDAILDGLTVECQAHIWSVDGCECVVCHRGNATAAHRMACGPCRVAEEERAR